MKVIEVREWNYTMLETDDEDYPNWRRWPCVDPKYATWEHSVCMEWYPCDVKENEMIEALYQEYIANAPPVQTEEERNHWAEEYECAMMFLNDMKVPTTEGGETLSLVGRIDQFINMQNVETQKLIDELNVYRQMFHTLQMHRDVCMNAEKVTEFLNLISDWSYAHRMGNGMLDNKIEVAKQIEKMKSWN